MRADASASVVQLRPQTLGRRRYSYAAPRNVSDFLVATCFPSAPRHDTNRDQQQSQGETIMNETLAAWTPRVLSVLRIYAGLLLFAHGTAKILGFPAVPNFANVQINSLVGASGLIELIGGALFTIGLFTRPVAFILSGFAAVAYFLVSAPKGFHPILNNGELASLFSFVFLYFVCAGPGPWSLDAMMKRK
jgi:putative oxidoreductase